MKYLLYLVLTLMGIVAKLLPGYAQCDIRSAVVSPPQQEIASGDTTQIILEGGAQPQTTYVLYRDGVRVRTPTQPQPMPGDSVTWDVSEPGQYTVLAQRGGCSEPMDGQSTVTAQSAPPDDGGGPGGCADLYPIDPPTATSMDRCGPGSVTLRASTDYDPPYDLRWYDSDGDFLATGPTYTTPSLTRTTDYEVRTERQAADGSFCESRGTFVRVTIDGPPTEAGPDLTAYRGSGLVMLEGMQPAGGTWTVSPGAAADALNGNTFDTSHPSVADGTYILTYTVAASGSCSPSDSRRVAISTLTNNYNYVVQDVFRVSGATPATMSSLSVAQRSRHYTYLDGQGRTMQEVQWRGSPNQNSLRQSVEYDELSRVARQYLPYVAGSSGDYQNNGTLGFYSSPPAGVTGDSKPYALTDYEASPLSRPRSTTGPGNAWHQANKKSVYKYQITTGGSVYKLSIGSGRTNLPVKSGTYGAGELALNEASDEDGRTSRSYTNKSGETVLREVQDDSVWLATYYVYDDYGNLRYVLPPQAMQKIGNTFSGTAYQNVLKQLAFQYVYDKRQRMIFRRTPGTDAGTEMVYDERDRLVLSQNARQAELNQWSFVKYDALNRPVMTGVYSDSRSRSDLETAIATKGFAESRTGSTVGYSLTNSFPSVSEADVRTVTYYDNYGFTSYSYDGDKIDQPIGQTTGSRTRVLGGNTWLTTVVWYDYRHRIMHTVSENHKGGTDEVTHTYDFVGNLLTRTHRHNNSLTLRETYRYDHSDRLLEVTHQTDSESAVTLAEYKYNELGEVIEKNLHQRGNDAFAQSVDYRYNIRGWLQHINGSTLQPDATVNPDTGQPADLFGLDLLYQKETLSLPTP